ncbi:MAG: bifunctional phosphopantothenoylcysteine decarboxylase/phosphopantothenate--cysteine ligase CoaBC [Candidatus Desulfofervidaceae bacterium]|nr:bifunctional phosphopantothenoylcysteine decarboxylase/phosphopantothenate--cysteine ligase CoaBC [Candidatus Desulfofervidaceae bacterium]
MLKDKHILIGITGSIAAYRIPDLIRLLQGQGAEVKVILTKGAQAFITPLTFAALTRNQVYTDIFEFYPEHPVIHLDLGAWADAFVIAPASANILAKLAQGIADDLLTSTVLGCKKPVLICPAMNTNMYFNAAVQANIARLREFGMDVMTPAQGKLACGVEGAGRLPDVQGILEKIEAILLPQDLAGYKMLVTAGPTQEPIDPVRFISNRSSGKMGLAIACAACQRGAEVTLISGPTHLKPPYGVNFIPVTTAEEMKNAILKSFPQMDAVIMAAAVADFKPAYVPHKIKKSEQITLSMQKTDDILSLLGQQKQHQLLVGFAAETQNLIKEACKKIRQKNLDMIVANNVMQPGAGFEVSTNQVTIIYRNGVREQWPLMTKKAVAMRLLDRVKELLSRCRMS